jgi:ubiquinone/menaquinone biosynthesis C-methylase UbiE
VSDPWGAIESAPDPEWFVRFLDRTSTQPGDRHPALALLELGPDQNCLDVGSGLGEDARAIAGLYGARVVGIDRNSRMVAEATRRAAASPRLDFVPADAAHLPFADAAFDGAWVKRTLMHLPNPERAIGEMARVVRSGGRIVAVEPDLEVVLIDSSLAGATRKVLARRAASFASPWVGRQLRGLLLASGLTDVRVLVHHTEFTDLASAERVLRLLELARSVLTPEEWASWEEDLRARDAAGRFACYVPWFVARGQA